MDKTAGMTIDELARASGCSARTIRALQGEGLVPPPLLRGRTGYYGEDHRRRLAAVRRLQGEGFSVAALRALIAAYDEGATLEDVLGLPSRGGRRAPAREAVADPFEGFPSRRHRGGVLAVVPTPILDDLLGEAAS